LKYKSEDYFSVIEIKTGRKICDCADELDALMMVSFDPTNRTITRNQFLMGQVVDIEMPKQLPTTDIVPVQKEPPKTPKKLKEYKNKLQQSELEPLNL
jgi:hypothetical protein